MPAFIVSLPCDAQTRPGAVGNELLRNPYSDAADGAYGRGIVSGDFDGDGIRDLAISESSSTRLRILRGVAWTIGGGSAIHYASTTIDVPQHQYEMATGDFDGDGRDEIAVSGSAAGGGKVYVMNRATNGTWSVQSTIQPGGAYPGAPQSGADFGSGLAAGDFDDDGFDDLAIGIRGQTVSGVTNAGAIMVTYGSAQGIGAAHARIINRNSDGLTFAPAEDDYYGWALAAGDFDGDHFADLAVGVPGAACPDGENHGGAVVVLRSAGSAGITNAATHVFRPGVLGLQGNCASSQFFGAALVAADFSFNFDLLTHSELAIGAPFSGPSGEVHVLEATSDGLTTEDNLHLIAPELPGGSSVNGWFGNRLAARNLARDCDFVYCNNSSLVIGAPMSTVGGFAKAGVAWIIDAGTTLLPATLRPIVPGPALKVGAPHENDQFGSALATGDFNGDGLADLAIGSYLFDDGPDVDAGAVQVLYQSEFLFVDGFD